jgi:hypothetical protein
MTLRLRLAIFTSAFIAVILSAVAVSVYLLTERSLSTAVEERARPGAGRPLRRRDRHRAPAAARRRVLPDRAGRDLARPARQRRRHPQRRRLHAAGERARQPDQRQPRLGLLSDRALQALVDGEESGVVRHARQPGAPAGPRCAGHDRLPQPAGGPDRRDPGGRAHLERPGHPRPAGPRPRPDRPGRLPGVRLGRVVAGAPRAGARAARHAGGRAGVEQGPAAARAGARDRRRAARVGALHQPHARPAPGVVRDPAALHGRRQPRAADAGDGDRRPRPVPAAAHAPERRAGRLAAGHPARGRADGQARARPARARARRRRLPGHGASR